MSLLVAAVTAQDVFAFGHKALVGQAEGASLAVEAVFVPGAALIVHHIHSFTETCDGVLAAVAFLRHRRLVAVDAEDVVLVFGEAGAGQRFGAAAAHKAMRVPRLVLVVHSSGGYGLFAADTVFCKFLVVTRAAVGVASFGEEALRSYWTFTVGAGEAFVVPRVPLVLHALCACRYGFVAAVAAWGVLSGAALAAHDAVVLHVEGLLGQILVTLDTAEALLVPVAAPVAQLLGLHGDGPAALGAGVGAELGVAADAHRFPLAADESLPTEVIATVEAVRAGGHLYIKVQLNRDRSEACDERVSPRASLCSLSVCLPAADGSPPPRLPRTV